MGRSLLLGCIIVVVSCAPDEAPSDDIALVETDPRAAPSDTPAMEPTSPPDAPADDRADDRAVREASPSNDPVLVASDASASAPRAEPNRCERLRLQVDEHGRRRFQRIRSNWSAADKQRFGRLVGLVAEEMGADPRLIRAWAMRESSYHPRAMHVLNADIEAATAAWQRLHYSPKEEAELQTVMADLGARDRGYWKAKARLHQVQTFRSNPHLDALLFFEVVTADGERSSGSEPAWTFGYGPFGFNPAYFVPVWDARAPPWVFCSDDGLVAIITAVWAARAAQRECEGQGFAGSYAAVNRRFSSGHCGTVPANSSFHARARRLGLDPDARAKLGRRWKRGETDRAEILRQMRRKAVDQDLLPASIL